MPSRDTDSQTDALALLSDWTGPHGGLIPFDRVKVSAFEPALEEAMRLNLAEIDAIASDPAAPDFDNTIAALERCGRALDRVMTLYGVWTGSVKTPDMQAVETRMEPRLAAFRDRIVQNAALFARIEAVHQSAETSDLTPEQQRLTWVIWNGYVKQGARLDETAKARVTAINQQLAGLYSQFGQNLLADEAQYVLYLTPDDLDGLPASMRQAAAAEAEERGRSGQFAIPNTRSWMEPFLTYCARRDLRERIWRTYYSRGDNRDANDNVVAVIPSILKLRAERARLMGFDTYAAWKLQDAMAKTPDQAMDQLMRVWPFAVARVREEVAQMQAIADQAGADPKPIAPWDYRYYAEKVRKARYDLDMEQVKPYLQLHHLREGMFWAAGQLYGFSFAEVKDAPLFDAAMSLYEIMDRAGRHAALWYFDPYARPIKASGAWMEQYRPQQKLDRPTAAIVSNNCNFVKPPPGQPVLVSWDDAVTLFHEFGHALHAVASDVVYPTLSGTNVARDFVEFPSQINENWLATHEVLSRFAVNAQGEAIPQGLVDKLLAGRTFNTGFAVTEYLAAAIVDMKLHTLPQGPDDPPIDVDAFEKATLDEMGMPPEIVMRHRTAQFGHIFQSDGYAAGYYSYLWAEVLDHDAYEAFTEAGGPYDPQVAQRLLDDVLRVGNTVDPAVVYRNFRGRDPQVDAYLRAKGFAA